MHCLSCNYDLSELSGHRCPECGRAFDPDDPKSYDSLSDPSMRFFRSVVRWGIRILAVVSANLLALYIAVYLLGRSGGTFWDWPGEERFVLFLNWPFAFAIAVVLLIALFAWFRRSDARSK